MTRRLLPELGAPALTSLADALAGGRLDAPYSVGAVVRYVSYEAGPSATAVLTALAADGLAPHQIARVLRFVAEERKSAQRVSDRVELVWSGPELPGATTRDTAVVVRDLFLCARRSILVSSYALDFGERARALFRPLADRMDEAPELEVRMFLNIARPHGSDAPAEALVHAFAERFKNELWPGTRLPEVFHDPRALDGGTGPRACLHAKCVIADGERVFITSANLTEAAHERNIEAGVLLDDDMVARSLASQFETLAAAHHFARVPGL